MLEFRTAPVRFTDRLRPGGLRPDRAPRCPADSLGGLCVLVTDACSDVGRATATRLAMRGARLVLVARRSDQLVGVCEEITATGGLARWHRCDLSALGDIDQLVDWVRGEFGAVDVLVNNATRPQRRPVTQSLDRFRDYQRTMAANYFGPLRLTLGLLPAMLQSGSGHVINVGPLHPNAAATPYFASYASSVAAWTTFGQCADAELAPHGIQVSAVRYPVTGTDTDEAAADFAVTAAESARTIENTIRERYDTPRSRRPALTRALRGLADAAPRSTQRLIDAFGR
ncbi:MULTISPECIES: SDR family NAD(P)-dependent oxidoreductase [Nocardia]|uniref:SDR family NAD(P)-dependent oxidoreductase n=1 Tax=Nocardia TaxID=1817 RepID=UPI000D691D71|nr:MULTISPECIES: SDR family NAD(P)-dependent oxidoreductase [Nocardia]